MSGRLGGVAQVNGAKADTRDWAYFSSLRKQRWEGCYQVVLCDDWMGMQRHFQLNTP